MQKKSKKEGKTLSIRHLLCTVIFFILGLPIYPVTLACLGSTLMQELMHGSRWASYVNCIEKIKNGKYRISCDWVDFDFQLWIQK